MAHGHAESKWAKRMGIVCWPLRTDTDQTTQLSLFVKERDETLATELLVKKAT